MNMFIALEKCFRLVTFYFDLIEQSLNEDR